MTARPQPPSSLPDAEPLSQRRKTMVHFHPELDWELIQEAHARNPYGEDHGKKTVAWGDVAKAISVHVDHRRCRERCNLALDNYQQRQQARAAEEEQYLAEKKVYAELLEMREGEYQRQNDQTEQNDDREQEDEIVVEIRDEQVRERAVLNQSTSTQFLSQQQILYYLLRRDTDKRELKERQLMVEERKLVLEERQLELDERRLELEKQERLAFVELMKTIPLL